MWHKLHTSFDLLIDISPFYLMNSSGMHGLTRSTKSIKGFKTVVYSRKSLQHFIHIFEHRWNASSASLFQSLSYLLKIRMWYSEIVSEDFCKSIRCVFDCFRFLFWTIFGYICNVLGKHSSNYVPETNTTKSEIWATT